MDRALAAITDQYFTTPVVAARCLDVFMDVLGNVSQPMDLLNTLWIEPAAGSGVFVDLLASRGQHVWGGDIHPQHPDIHQHDYLLDKLPRRRPKTRGLLVIGNPPFGRKASLATAFINRALAHAGMVGFIVPLQLRKWSAQKRIDKSARLLLDISLPHDSFLFLGKPYRLRCCFQVWTTWSPQHLPGADLRLAGPPRISHPDFTAWQYNCTDQAIKYFDYPWDFAVLRQGYGDFSVLHPPSTRTDLDRRRQWIFIKAASSKALKRLRSIDYTALSHHNTGTPGFGKADLVHAYEHKL